MAKSFEDLEVWKKARLFYWEISSIFWSNFKDFFFKDQILRATLSISNNIAEGFERKYEKEFIRFLYISKWSCWEVRSMLYIAFDKKYISEEKFEDLIAKSKVISSMLHKLIEYYFQKK